MRDLDPHPLKVILVSDASPRPGQVYGLRMAAFAAALARRGHRIVLLTPTAELTGPVTEPGQLPALLERHDWAGALHVSRAPNPSALLAAIRENRLPGPIRKSMTALLLALQGGMHGDWVAGARALFEPLARALEPDMVWATFGSTSTLVAGQQLARCGGLPWVMDVKDNWELFLRPGLRELLARRFRDAAGFTSNSEFHADIAARHHRQPHAVIHSGVAPEMVAPAGSVASCDVFQVTLIGSIYDEAALARFLSAFERWLRALAPGARGAVVFRYAGVACEEVSRALEAAPLSCATRADKNLPHAELARLCHDAAANCYIWAPSTFHHKLLELIACRRPVIAFRGEHEESKRLAVEVGGMLMACADEAALADAFEAAFSRWQRGQSAVSTVDISRYSWDSMAAKIEGFLIAVLGQRSGFR